MKKIIIGSDHGGHNLKNFLKEKLIERGLEIVDFSETCESTVDYPLVAKSVAEELINNNNVYNFGILICGTGIGISIASNKIKGIRAALCSDSFSARMAKEHNNANIICFGERVIGTELAWDLCKVYMDSTFQDGIHSTRVAQISDIESA